MIRRMGGIRKNFNMPVLMKGDEIAITNKEKAEMLVEIFVKVNSSSNLTERLRRVERT
ncbi:MAG: hypothetical protein ACRCW9_08655 [Cetobacterium sp.]